MDELILMKLDSVAVMTTGCTWRIIHVSAFSREIIEVTQLNSALSCTDICVDFCAGHDLLY